jgi:hypothetical protein
MHILWCFRTLQNFSFSSGTHVWKSITKFFSYALFSTTGCWLHFARCESDVLHLARTNRVSKQSLMKRVIVVTCFVWPTQTTKLQHFPMTPPPQRLRVLLQVRYESCKLPRLNLFAVSFRSLTLRSPVNLTWFRTLFTALCEWVICFPV